MRRWCSHDGQKKKVKFNQVTVYHKTKEIKKGQSRAAKQKQKSVSKLRTRHAYVVKGLVTSNNRTYLRILAVGIHLVEGNSLSVAKEGL